MKTKIYLACFPTTSMGDYIGYALAEDGVACASHLSSSIGWAKHDLGLTSNWKHDTYDLFYPDGYELEWVDDPKNHAGWQAAMVKNRAQADDGTPVDESAHHKMEVKK